MFFSKTLLIAQPLGSYNTDFYLARNIVRELFLFKYSNKSTTIYYLTAFRQEKCQQGWRLHLLKTSYLKKKANASFSCRYKDLKTCTSLTTDFMLAEYLVLQKTKQNKKQTKNNINKHKPKQNINTPLPQAADL